MHLAGWELSISLAGSEGRINFSQQSPSQNAQNGFKKLYSCSVVVFRSFSQNFPLGAPVIAIFAVAL